MNANLDKIAQDLYGKIQTRFPDIQMGDENAAVLSKKEDIPKARFFEFEYTEDGEPLGTIAITLDADDGVVVQVSGDLVNDNDDTTHHGAYKFIRSFRQFARDRLLNFDVQNIGKSNLDKRDYQFQAKRKEEPQMPAIMENKLYGNAKMSYQDLGEARLVIKHTQPVNLELAAGRTMHIESIYIENAQGERFRYPAKHLNGARALAEHIKHGGNPYDAIGKHIIGLSEELSSLRKFKGFVSRQEQISEAMGNVTDKVVERIEQIKETIQKLQRTAYYESFVESFEAQDEVMIPEEVQNDLIDRLTVRTFNEELKSVFPYIYKFVDESELPVVELGADDLLDEVFDGDKEEGTTHKGGKVTKTKHGIKHTKTNYDDGEGADYKMFAPDTGHRKNAKLDYDGSNLPNFRTDEDKFESFLNNIIREDKDELFSPNKDAQKAAIEKFNTEILSKELKGGPDAIDAIGSLTGFIDDPEFLDSLKDLDPNLDVRAAVQDYVQSRDPWVASQLHFSGTGAAPVAPPTPPAAPAPAPAPAEPAPAPAPAPDAAMAAPAPDAAMAPPPEAAPAPVAEGKDEDPPFDPDPKPSKKVTAGKHGQDYSQARHLARKGLAGAIEKAKKAGATLDTKLDFGHKEMTLHDAIKECGMDPSEFGFEEENGLEAMMKFMSGFYNKEEGNFPLGGQRIKIKVKKAFEDGEFGNASPEDLMKVLKFIDMKDPSGDHQQQHDILRLAGVRHSDVDMEEAGEAVDPRMEKLTGLLQQLQGMQQNSKNNSTSSHTSTGTINGKPASYDDAMNQFKNMRLKFGDEELDFSNPDQMGDKIKGMMGNMMQGVQKQMPQGPQELPGGVGNLDFSKMLDMIRTNAGLK